MWEGILLNYVNIYTVVGDNRHTPSKSETLKNRSYKQGKTFYRFNPALTLLIKSTDTSAIEAICSSDKPN